MKMHKKKKTITLIVLLCVSLVVAAAGTWLFRKNDTSTAIKQQLPDAKEELSKIVQHFVGSDSMSNMSGTILLFDGEALGAVKETNKFVFMRQGNAFYSELGYQSTISNGQLIVQIDTMNRYLMVTRLSDSMMKSVQSSIMPLSSMLAQDSAGNHSEMEIKDDGKQRVLILKGGYMPQVKSYRINYDPATYAISSAEIEWWKDASNTNNQVSGKTWITKMNYVFNEAKPLNMDALVKKILLVKKNGIEVLDEQYKDYKLFTNGFNQ